MFHALSKGLVHFFIAFPPEFAAILLGMFPIVERFALPIAITKLHLPAWEAFLLVVAGNMIPVIGILALADKFHAWISQHSGFFGQAWAKSIAHAQKKFARYEKFGLWGLFIFLSIPTPVNGAFTASIIAFILGYPMQKSLPYLMAGVIMGNAITLALTLGAIKIF